MYYYINCGRPAARPSLIYGSACFILTVSLPGKGGRGMEKKKKKTRSGARLLPALLALTIGLGALAWIGYSRYTMFEGEILPRDTELLDLRGKDATEEKIAAAREALPNARVLYDVTIAGKTYSCDEKEIVTGDFAVGDIPLFSRFEGLESVDASECSDLEAIRALREALPGAEVAHSVSCVMIFGYSSIRMAFSFMGISISRPGRLEGNLKGFRSNQASAGFRAVSRSTCEPARRQGFCPFHPILQEQRFSRNIGKKS